MSILASTASVVSAQNCLTGDVNLDGFINFADALPFRDVFDNGPFQCEADGNYDLVIDSLDEYALFNIALDQQSSDFLDANVNAPGDFFWSTAELGDAAANEPLSVVMYEGHDLTLYLYYSHDGTAGNVNAGAAINVATSTPGIIQFTEAGAFNFIIEVAGVPYTTRWRDPRNGFYEVAQSIDDELIVGITGGGSLPSNGMSEMFTGNGPFLDTGYSEAAGAFLFGKVELTSVQGGDVTLVAGPNALGVANNYDLLDVAIATVNVHVTLSGDVNLDGSVNLLDVQPFVNLLGTGGYLNEADCNYDGAFNLLDVSPFIDKLQGD